MKDVSKTLSIAAVVAMVSAAGVTIAQTTESSVPNSNSPNAASSPYVAPTTSNSPSTSALPTTDGSNAQRDSGAAATPTLEQRQEGSGSMGSRNTPDMGASPSSTVDNSTMTTPAPADTTSSELPARADRG